MDERVLQFLWKKLGDRPQSCPDGPDLEVGACTVEVKACSEYVKDKHAKYRTRRKGRFHLHGYEHADYLLFVLVCESGLEFRLLRFSTIKRKFKIQGRTSINWTRLFKRRK